MRSDTPGASTIGARMITSARSHWPLTCRPAARMASKNAVPGISTASITWCSRTQAGSSAATTVVNIVMSVPAICTPPPSNWWLASFRPAPTVRVGMGSSQ
ncbi:hypothetical protein LMG1864_05038 [Achromobacter ruhlandii]|nr:hypothetical protein LMG1864_05038 [Achromobacter ruhlandii]